MHKISPQKLNGIVYTPDWIVKLILDKIGYHHNVEFSKIIDPACGTGAFLKEIVKRFIESARCNGAGKQEIANLISENIYGWDIDDYAISRCYENLDKVAERYGINNVQWNVIKADSLNVKFAKAYFGMFDYIVGNPPYVRIQHLGENKRKYIQKHWKLCRRGSTDIFIAFFELGYYLMNERAKLGYITPNTYIKTSASKDLRQFIKQKKLLEALIDFGYHQIFNDITTYSIITILSKRGKNNKFALFFGDSSGDLKFIDNVYIDNLNDENWVLASNEVLERIRHIETRGIPLGKLANIHVGITTLADDYYIFKAPFFDGDIARIKTKDGREFKIEKSILKPIVKASVLKSTNEEQNRFIIFPYRRTSLGDTFGKHQIIPESILSIQFPLVYEYFLSIRDVLLHRDKGKPNSVCWYAFGRSQGLDTSFGKKILTSPLNREPNFIVWEREEYTFYAGYCIKYDGDLWELAKVLNSEDMRFYIEHTGRFYQNNYRSYSKNFIKNFGIDNSKILSEYKRRLHRNLPLMADILQNPKVSV